MEHKIINKIETYLENLGNPYELVDDNMWVVHDDGEDLVIVYEDPTVIFRVKLMKIPSNNKEEFFEKLLRLNSTLLHGAYALENDEVVLLDCLEAENLDENEFQASIDSIIMAITNDYRELSKYLDS